MIESTKHLCVRMYRILLCIFSQPKEETLLILITCLITCSRVHVIIWTFLLIESTKKFYVSVYRDVLYFLSSRRNFLLTRVTCPILFTGILSRLVNMSLVLTHKAFRRVLIDHMSEPLRSQASQQARRRQPASQNFEHLQQVPHFPAKGRKRTDCCVCSDRRPGGKRHLTLYHCATCSTKPSLCMTPCFKTYHTQRNFHN